MKKLKDFIYDKNDIIIAVLILVVAALIITWRLNSIMEYPKQLINAEDPAIENNIDPVTNEKENTGDKGSENSNSESNSPSQSDEPANPEAPLWQGGILTKDVEVNVTGTNASSAIQCLIDAGLFKDYADYQSICKETGIDHEKVRAGNFTFERGSTKADIAKDMNWG